jgi:hypothetical protein
MLASEPSCASANSGEHRLLACSSRQLAANMGRSARTSAATFWDAFRQAAEKDRLAACAPRDERAALAT